MPRLSAPGQLQLLHDDWQGSTSRNDFDCSSSVGSSRSIRTEESLGVVVVIIIFVVVVGRHNRRRRSGCAAVAVAVTRSGSGSGSDSGRGNLGRGNCGDSSSIGGSTRCDAETSHVSDFVLSKLLCFTVAFARC